ncbi:scavenger receptor class F member 2-like [Haliotis rubra]|uniref:scavenger receptor class F member 2-like n=1 Tax=Haliotis rubra TaxID=36100 RepID=UPI001EE5FF54|nr:scavenger receptor class F member 2-like [Haliotis rubra]
MTRHPFMTVKNLCLMLPGIAAGIAAVSGAAEVDSPQCARWDRGLCVECYYGWFGHRCQRQCDRHCWHTGCYKHTGICEQCVPGKHGRDCNTDCPDNCRRDRDGRVNCDREGGGCLEGCREGWWGDTCNNPCNVNCKTGACHQTSGHCIGDCTRGWHGLACDKRCSAGCRGNICRCVTGVCTHGCERGWFGEKCTERKQQRECSFTCRSRECDMNGRCLKGCKNGFRGSTCIERCPDNCHICEQDTTSCTTCERGWQGRLCTNRSIARHHPHKGHPTFEVLGSPSEPTGGATGRDSGSILLLLVAVIISAMCQTDLSWYSNELFRIQDTSLSTLQKLRTQVKRSCMQIACHEYSLGQAFVNWRFQRPSISDR